MDVWICGQFYQKCEDTGSAWGFHGVFSSEDKARAACASESYFIGPAVMDQELPEHPFDWPGAYYPHAKEVTNDIKG
jgi:hypothetical protein